jgi:hypothetical protein
MLGALMNLFFRLAFAVAGLAIRLTFAIAGLAIRLALALGALAGRLLGLALARAWRAWRSRPAHVGQLAQQDGPRATIQRTTSFVFTPRPLNPRPRR